MGATWVWWRRDTPTTHTMNTSSTVKEIDTTSYTQGNKKNKCSPPRALSHLHMFPSLWVSMTTTHKPPQTLPLMTGVLFRKIEFTSWVTCQSSETLSNTSILCLILSDRTLRWFIRTAGESFYCIFMWNSHTCEHTQAVTQHQCKPWLLNRQKENSNK